MQRSPRYLVSGRHGGERVPSGGSCGRRAAAGKAGAAKLKTLGPSACAAPRTRRCSYALTLRKVCRAGFAGRGMPSALSTGRHSRCPSPTRDRISGRRTKTRGGGIDGAQRRPMLWCMRARRSPRRWSREVTERSNALDLEMDVFKLRSPRAMAESLRRSAERSRRRKAGPFQSAMSMLNFYINRAGRNLAPSRRRTLKRAKGELRRLYGRE